ncbi:MAG: hypothetical protein IJG84_11550 [Kiritimatiellae bacterium]|nr:hypothetical protein [Kiritimatiellia bacterium]
MIAVIEQESDSPKIPFVVKNGMMFFNCTQDTIDRAVENENRRKAYLRIGEWENIP